LANKHEQEIEKKNMQKVNEKICANNLFLVNGLKFSVAKEKLNYLITPFRLEGLE
jgi:hypothetical protein